MHHLAMAVCPFLGVKTAEPFSGLQATLHFGQLKCQLKMSFYICLWQEGAVFLFYGTTAFFKTWQCHTPKHLFRVWYLCLLPT